jgi:hypothetical protein
MILENLIFKINYARNGLYEIRDVCVRPEFCIMILNFDLNFVWWFGIIISHGIPSLTIRTRTRLSKTRAHGASDGTDGELETFRTRFDGSRGFFRDRIERAHVDTFNTGVLRIVVLEHAFFPQFSRFVRVAVAYNIIRAAFTFTTERTFIPCCEHTIRASNQIITMSANM